MSGPTLLRVCLWGCMWMRWTLESVFEWGRWHFPLGWAPSNLLKGQTEEKGRGRENSPLCLPVFNLGRPLLLPLHSDSDHLLSWVPACWLQTQNLLSLYHCVSHWLISCLFSTPPCKAFRVLLWADNGFPINMIVCLSQPLPCFSFATKMSSCSICLFSFNSQISIFVTYLALY